MALACDWECPTGSISQVIPCRILPRQPTGPAPQLPYTTKDAHSKLHLSHGFGWFSLTTTASDTLLQHQCLTEMVSTQPRPPCNAPSTQASAPTMPNQRPRAAKCATLLRPTPNQPPILCLLYRWHAIVLQNIPQHLFLGSILARQLLHRELLPLLPGAAHTQAHMCYRPPLWV